MSTDLEDSSASEASFDSIFGGEDQKYLTLDRFDDYWERTRPLEADRKGVDPNKLVRFVLNGKVNWITQDEASLYLQISDDTDKRQTAVKKEIKRAMRGEFKSLSDELSVLLAISASTLGRYKEEQAIPEEEIRRIEPTLQRRFQEVEQLTSAMREIEKTIEAKRKREPIFEEYESKLGRMMNLQRQGKTTEAANLAQELAAKKRQYVIMSRALEPDIYTSYYYRMELQKTKKRVLNVQKYLSAQREDSLENEIRHLKQELHDLKSAKEQEDDLKARGVTVDTDEYENRVEKIDKTEKKIEKGSSELSAIEKETKLIATQIENVDDVIAYINDEVLKDSGYEDSIEDQVRSMMTRQKLRKPKFPPIAAKFSSRMVIVQHRESQSK